MSNFKITNKGLYWGLIVTFGLLYVLVAFVSTLHAIDFFKLANITSLAVLLGIAYELGQATVLFSILMTKNKEKFLPWLLMILLTALQVTANVYASFKHMSLSGNEDWTYWYTSILKIFGVQGGNTETYQVIISWISGALLPIVALGMTALVAQNIKLMTEEDEGVISSPHEDEVNSEEITPIKDENLKEEKKTEDEVEKVKTTEEDITPTKEETPFIEDEIKVKDDSVEAQNIEETSSFEPEIELPKSIIEPSEDVPPTPSVKDEPTEEIEPQPPGEVKETEEERQERLRNIAREKLKKK